MTTEEEFNFKIHLLWKAMDSHLLIFISRKLWEYTDSDEQASILMGLLNSNKNSRSGNENLHSR